MGIITVDTAIIRARKALKSAGGAFDLPSIITGVVVVAILTAGVFAAVFGVIPFAQDHAAKQNLSSVRTAEGVAKVRDSLYMSSDGLSLAAYLPASPDVAVGSDDAGTCWVGIAKSGSGKRFYATDTVMEPKLYTSSVDTGCLSSDAQAALAAKTGPSEIVPVGYVSSWGSNGYGKLGTGASPNRKTPGDVLQTTYRAGTVTSTSVSGGHTCTVSEGAAYCWGANDYGALGNGTTDYASVPTKVSGLEGKTVTAIAAGEGHTCAVADGAAYCWGDNGQGKLGKGSAGNTSLPVPVKADASGDALFGKTVTDITAGSRNACAIADGRAYCWGWGYTLGANTSGDALAPVAVDASKIGSTVTAISSGSLHTCAISAGATYCWGSNSMGELGYPQGGYAYNPGAVPGPMAANVTAISAGQTHTCGVASGAAYCWGDNGSGQLGNDSAVAKSEPAVAVLAEAGLMGGKTVTAVTAGFGRSCAVADGKAYCWGYGPSGELGNGGTAQTRKPVAVTAAAGVLEGKAVSAIDTSISQNSSTPAHTCAVADGSMYCWGKNSRGQLGNSTTIDSTVPVAIVRSGVFENKVASAVSAGGNHACAVASGTAYCWGNNSYGQLGNGNTTASAVPVAVTGGLLAGKTVTSVAAGGDHSCAVADEAVYCWGRNGDGQLGNGTNTGSIAPVLAGGELAGKKATAVTANSWHTCAIADGKAYCWGNNASGRSGTAGPYTSPNPTAVVATGELKDKTVTGISAADEFTCAVADGAAYCWGANGWGQLGNSVPNSSHTPVAVRTDGVLAGKTITQVSAGGYTTCAIADNEAYCWGYNPYGAVGNGTTSSGSTPVKVTSPGLMDGKKVTSIATSGGHTCAVASDEVYCWGSNGSGQFGNGTTTGSTVPVKTTGSLAGKKVSTVAAGGDFTLATYK